jgi:hypothetical protein
MWTQLLHQIRGAAFLRMRNLKEAGSVTLIGDSIIDWHAEHRSIRWETLFKPIQIGCYTLALEAVSVSLVSPIGQMKI